MSEQRQYKRFKVDLFGIHGKMTFAKEVKIVDLSPGGVALKADRRLNINGDYTLKIEGKGKVLTVKGMVVWSIIHESIEDSSGNIIPIYTAGMKFIDVSNDKKNEIVHFIEDQEQDVAQEVFSLNNLRLHVRIQFDTPKKALLNFHDNYEVKKISLSGMLMESQNALESESRLPMEISLTEDKSIKFTGRVASCLLTKDQDIKNYDIGVEFLDLSDKDREILHEFISALESKNAGSSSQ